MLIIDQIDCGRYPYKPVYGPPVECTMEQKEAFDYCEIKALRYYGTKIDDFVSNDSFLDFFFIDLLIFSFRVYTYHITTIII